MVWIKASFRDPGLALSTAHGIQVCGTARDNCGIVEPMTEQEPCGSPSSAPAISA
jgi:hypothetical protein